MEEERGGPWDSTLPEAARDPNPPTLPAVEVRHSYNVHGLSICRMMQADMQYPCWESSVVY